VTWKSPPARNLKRKQGVISLNVSDRIGTRTVILDVNEKAAVMFERKRKEEKVESAIKTDPAEGRVTPMRVRNAEKGVERKKRRNPRRKEKIDKRMAAQ
jgi:hypothetical protein